MRVILLRLLLCAALVSSPPPLFAAPPLATPETSPVRCTPERIEFRSLNQRRSVLPAPVITPTAPPAPPPPPGPPPPPPPPPSMVMGAPVASAMVTGSRVIAPTASIGDRYAAEAVAGIMAVAEAPVSTFSVDVDTGAYANARRFLNEGVLPPPGAVRTEEMLNYFRYDYPAPRDRSRPFSVTTDVAITPWNSGTRLLRIGIRGYDVPRAERPAANLVFLVDVSGSMSGPDRLPLATSALQLLADRLNPRDRVSIVVYAGAAGIVLEPTHDKRHVAQALACLQAGGSTAGGQGIQLAYATARANLISGGINRVILATDGDFNVGVSSDADLKTLIRRNRDDGITLSVLGFGRGNSNEAAMEAIADSGNGNYSYIDSLLEARKVLDEELSSTLFTIAKDVKIQVEFNPAAVREYRLIGYENRRLAEEDFANDAVDAGDIGAGHMVTALYELVPAGSPGWRPERRYATNRVSAPTGAASEAAWLKLRYKLPDGVESRLIEQPIRTAALRNAAPVRGDFAFAAAVGAYGQKLRGDPLLDGFSHEDIRGLAVDPTGYARSEFVELLGLAESLAGKSLSVVR